MSLLSIVVPIRDMGGMLGPLFDWAKVALSLDCEVILVHDYLEAETEKELRAFVNSNQYQKLFLISSTFNSPGLARNAGLSLVTGEYVAFWDSDDIPNVRKVVEFVQNCHVKQIEIGIGSFQTRDQDGNYLKTYSTSLQNSLPKIAMNPGLWRMVFKKTILKDTLFNNLKLAEDQVFLASLSPAEKTVLYNEEIVYIYTVLRQGSLTSKKSNVSDLNQAIKMLINQIQSTQNIENLRFSLALIIKNSLTVIKIGSNKDRIIVFLHACKPILRNLRISSQVALIILRFKRGEMKN